MQTALREVRPFDHILKKLTVAAASCQFDWLPLSEHLRLPAGCPPHPPWVKLPVLKSLVLMAEAGLISGCRCMVPAAAMLCLAAETSWLNDGHGNCQQQLHHDKMHHLSS